jgi:hypothetical protein
MSPSDSPQSRRLCDVEAATLAHDGSPPIARITLPACRAHYPGGPNGCICRLLPPSRGLPHFAGGSASASSLSRPAQASLALRPVGSLSRPRRPLSRGFDPVSCPTGPLVSYQTNRHLPGCNLPPLVTRAVGAHSEIRVTVLDLSDGLEKEDLARRILSDPQRLFIEEAMRRDRQVMARDCSVAGTPREVVFRSAAQAEMTASTFK